MYRQRQISMRRKNFVLGKLLQFHRVERFVKAKKADIGTHAARNPKKGT